ncbi:MAG: HAMP domain-containing protein [Oceanospirillaceae bacterium]|jgi:two-component system C4-dicarboxylate transport sensor histidine kinase DctB|nr:HAMP domain-containing protein [Oceanospirillaceae bacterium]HAZ79484.1 two-component sensor histidine kinase [Porticoccaceae bacterium]MBT6100428.1 HAMP domain-containing protein [Oceanospirillaceae bacterium]MBT7674978.1 HAMP domain-containing protein [Oceanospirillaceae bacterium]MDB0001514.1 ATP-binding protein [Oceanospirillaceae bacterium]|tara:strand:+ start:193 stop:2154 length:1962 start_codon:yes stop_codon:yes gene_type:complete
MKIFRGHSIRDRLFTAFGVLSLLTLITSVIGWSLHNQLGNQLKSVVEQDIPSLGSMVKLSTEAATITSLAPALMAVQDSESRKLLWQQLNQGTQAIASVLPQIHLARSAMTDRQVSLDDQLQGVIKTLNALNQNILQQLKLKMDKEAESQGLRWAVSGFLADIDPLIDKTQKYIRSRFNEDIPSSGIVIKREGERTIAQLNTDLQVLFRLKADTSLLVNLVGRAHHLPDPDSLIATAIQADELNLSIVQYIDNMSLVKGFSELRVRVDEVLYFVQRDLNMFELRRQERLQFEAGEQLLTSLEIQLASFNDYISTHVTAVREASMQAVAQSNNAIAQGNRLMIATSLASVMLSILIVWLYVAKHLVGRIRILDGSMRIIAAGNLQQSVPVKGRDEIGTMANSLRSFRDQLTEKQAELVQAGKLAALGQLSAGISHEINQPLTAIGHYAHNGVRLLQQGRAHEAEANFEQISSLTKRSTSIIARLKSMARKRRDSIQTVCLNQVVDHVLTLLQSHSQTHSTEIVVDMPSENNMVMAEQIQLEQVVLNLMSNALDAVADNLHTKKITIECLHSEGQIELRIADNGPGIAPELYEQVFNPFFTTKEVDQGLGLGLSISYNIIQDFGGQLAVVRHPMKGAIFSLRLPHNSHFQAEIKS